MKKIISMILSLVMIVSLLSTNVTIAFATEFVGGDGTKENPYQISTIEQLKAISETRGHFVLLNDIDLQGSESNQWKPINLWGNLDGNFHKITGLYINNALDRQGFIGSCGGTVKNISVYGTVKAANEVGGIAGYNTGTIISCQNYATVSGSIAVGGIAGSIYEGFISRSANSGRISGEKSIGGILGYLDAVSATNHNIYASVNNSYNVGGISGKKYVAGIVGARSGNSQITNCYNIGQVKATESCGNIYGSPKSGGGFGATGVINCYYLDNGVDNSHGTPLNRASMQLQSSYNNWNFNDIWILNPNINDGFPTLKDFIKGILLSGEKSIDINSETVLKATRYDENGNITPEGGITWSCSDESLAQITPWGNNVTVKGLKGGKATITAIHSESGQKADFEIEVVSYVMTLAGGYTVMLDEELEINYAVKQGEEYVHNDLDIKWEIESKDSNNSVKIISDKDNAYTRALTIKGINEGECELVAKVDGAELGRTKIEVLGNLADTINDETIIRAKYLVNNSQYKYYKNYNSVHGMFADEMDLTPSIVKYSLDNYLSVFYKSIYKGKSPDEVTATEFYECVLVKLLNDDENVKVFGKVGDVMSDYILKYGKKIAEKGTKIDDTNKKQLKEICKGLCGDGLEDVGFIDTLLISGKSIETYFEEYAKIYQMASCTNEQIKAIKLIKNSTSDKALKTACDNVIKSIEKAQADTAKYAVSSGTTKTAEQLSEYAFEKMVGALEKFSPALAAFDLVKEITSPINNILFQADDIESDTIDLYALIVIENALKDAISSAEKTFNSNPTAEKAENLMAAADFYKNVQLYGCDICDSLLENYGEAKRNQGIAWDTLVIIMKNVVNREVKMSDVFNALFGNVDSETLDNRKTLSDIRKLIDSADFYGSEGTDVAEFIREVKSTTPSEWIVESGELERAKNLNILPDYMQNNYQNNITRAEFCTILTWMIEEKTGKGIGQLIEEKGTPIKSPFEDTYYEYADYMCKLGIVNGVSATEFNPLGEITREQAATMLMRTADVLGYDTSYNTSVESGVSSWATEGVGFVTEKGIMNGTGNGFEPQGKYTKEQAIATFVRMYDNLK